MRAKPNWRAGALLAVTIALLSAPLAAQQPVPIDIGPVAPIPDPEPQGDAQETPSEPDEGGLIIDILAAVEPEMSPGEEIAYEACIAEQDAARLRGEIIVCRRRSEDAAAYSGFDKEEWERDYARRTQGVKTPNVAGAGGTIIMPGEGSLITITVSTKFGDPPEKALIIDVGALPEAPAGSDADRIAHRTRARALGQRLTFTKAGSAAPTARR